MSGLGYLLVAGLGGRVRRALALVKTPRYALGMALGVAYLGVFVFGPLVASRATTAGAPFQSAEVVRAARAMAAVVVGLMLVLQCATAEEGLAFRDAELSFLQAAPLARSWLVAYRLLDGQLAIFGAALVFGSAAWLVPGGSAWSIPGTLVALELLLAARVYCSMATGSLRDRGRSTGWLKLVSLGVIVALLTAAGLSAAELARRGRPLWTATRAIDPATALDRLARVDPLRTALRPFDALGALLLPTSPAELACASAMALALCAALVAGIFASRSRFVPASLAQSRRVADLRHRERGDGLPEAASDAAAAVRTRSWARDYAPFALGSRGSEVVAFMWLALVAAGPRLAPRRTVGWVVAALAVGLVASGLVPGAAQIMVAVFALQIALTLAAIGGQRMASDLVGQPARFALLKSLPAKGQSIVMGEVAANAAVQSTLGLVGWWFAVGLVREIDGTPLPVIGRVAAWIAGSLLIVSLALLIHASTRALALFLPGWFRTGGLPAQGMAAFGQNLLVLLARVAVLMVASVPAGLAGGGVALLALATLGRGETGVAVAMLCGGSVAACAFAGVAWGTAWVAGEVAYPRCRPAELA